MRPMTRLAFSTNAFKKSTLTEAVDAIARSATRGRDHGRRPACVPARYAADDRRRLKSQLAGRRIPVSNVNAFTHFADGDTYHPTWIEDDAELPATTYRAHDSFVELAHDLGAKTSASSPAVH